MALDRDETILRLAVADMASPQMPIARGGEAAWADGIVARGDALLARLRPEAVAPAPSRPEWVRITGPDDAEKVTVGNVYAVRSHSSDGTPNTITNDRGEEWYICLPGYKPSRTWPSWEPCAAPGAAPSPAASPAPYVPKCGDVVRHINDAPGTDDRIVTESLCDGAFRMLSLRYSNLSSSGYNVAAFWRFVRPATPAERAAAGLPGDEAPVSDGEACIAWLKREGWSVSSNAIAAWNEATRRARVAAKGGAK